MIRDMMLNIIASMMPIALLQLVIYPIAARTIGGNEYGLMITIYSAWNMISNSLGNVLNSMRLLYFNKYKDENANGDFIALYRKWNIVNAILISSLIIFYCKELNWEHLILGVICSIFILTKAYTEVYFRLILDYKSIVLNSILHSIGFLFGLFCLKYTGIWELIFIFGYLFSCAFCIIKSKPFEGGEKKTNHYGKLNKDVNKLTIATVIGTMMDYADKLVLYPLMGGTTVSIYYTATTLGRMVGLLTGPINSVILSYIVRLKQNPKALVVRVLIVGVILCIIGYIVTLIISDPIIKLLFPQWIDSVLLYIPVTTINVLLLVLVSIISPFVLKFCDLNWQIILNCISVLVYFCSALLLWREFGLMGYCVGAIIGTLTKLVIMITLYLLSQSDNKNCDSK